jgi:pyridoxine/pyridoxamine 5'-phosphate oxidase
MAIEYTRRFHDIPLQLADLQRHIWTQFQRAVHDKFHEWRTPVLATVDAIGAPQVRTVILRQVDVSSHQLTFFTDSRAPKVSQLLAQPKASLLFWSNRLSWQLRVQAHVSVLLEGPKVETVWHNLTQSPTATDYLSLQAPGTVLQSSHVAADSVPHLAILVADVQEIDWLELARSGHRRAQLRGHEAQWLVP